MLKIYPLSQPSLQWPQIINAVQEIGESRVTRLLDGNRLDYKDFLVAFTASDLFRTSPSELLAVSQMAQHHLSFSFAIITDTDTLIDIQSRTQIIGWSKEVEKGSRVALLTASLYEWNTAIKTYLSVKNKYTLSFDVRLFYDSLVVFFEQCGLCELWGSKKALADKTFLLE